MALPSQNTLLLCKLIEERERVKDFKESSMAWPEKRLIDPGGMEPRNGVMNC